MLRGNLLSSKMAFTTFHCKFSCPPLMPTNGRYVFGCSGYSQFSELGAQGAHCPQHWNSHSVTEQKSNLTITNHTAPPAPESHQALRHTSRYKASMAWCCSLAAWLLVKLPTAHMKWYPVKFPAFPTYITINLCSQRDGDQTETHLLCYPFLSPPKAAQPRVYPLDKEQPVVLQSELMWWWMCTSSTENAGISLTHTFAWSFIKCWLSFDWEETPKLISRKTVVWWWGSFYSMTVASKLPQSHTRPVPADIWVLCPRFQSLLFLTCPCSPVLHLY